MAAPGTCSWEGTATDGACVNWSGDGHSSSSSSSHDCGSETDNGETACNGHGGGGACSWNPQTGVSGASGACEAVTTGCTDGLPVREFAVKIGDTSTARANLCGQLNVLCGVNDIVAKFDVGTTTLSYDASNNWQVKSGGTVVLTTSGYKFNSVNYALTTAVTDLQLVDLVALNTQLDAGATVTNCDTTFNAALDAYTALQTPCEEVGNKNQDQTGACATGTDACVAGYEYVIDVCVPAAYVDTTSGTQEEKANAKKAHMQNVRKGGAKKRGTETDDDFKKRQFKEMKANTRAYLKSQFDTAKIANAALPQGQKVKPHVLRKQLRMPLSIAADSEDFKKSFRNKLREFFDLGLGGDRDVGIIVGPENLETDESCDTWIPAADFDDANDAIKCITYDAAIDGDTTDVHVLGNDDSYSVGGLLIGGKYEPVVKQTVANADTETFEVSCWSGAGTGWTAQDKDANTGGTQHWAAGDVVQCTVTKGGVVTVVDTIVGSLTTGQVDGDKCDVGYGCVTDDVVNPLVCIEGVGGSGSISGCELCQIPEANGEVLAAPCLAQQCVAGEGAFIPDPLSAGAIDLKLVDYGNGAGYGRSGVSFDDDLDPTDCGKVADENGDKCVAGAADDPNGNPNCVACPPGYYSESNDGYCHPHTTCGDQVAVDSNLAVNRLIDASATNEGTCADCAADTWAATPYENCQPQTECGYQVDGASRLTGASTTDAGSCADCDADTYAGLVTATCAAHTTCDQAQGAAGKAIKTAGTLEADTVCCDSADNDAICDDVDKCFINGCTPKQLTDAYATLKAGSDCKNSRRAQDHTKVFKTCYTMGCTTESQMQAMVDKFGTCTTAPV